MKLEYTVLHKFAGSDRPAHSHGSYSELAEAEKCLATAKEWVVGKDDDLFIMAHEEGTEPWKEVEPMPTRNTREPDFADKELMHAFFTLWQVMGETLKELGVINQTEKSELTTRFLGWHQAVYSR